MLGSPAEAYYGSATSLTSGFKTSMNDYIYDTFLNNKYAQIAKEASLSDYSSMEDILKSIGLGATTEELVMELNILVGNILILEVKNFGIIINIILRGTQMLHILRYIEIEQLMLMELK